MSKATDWKPKLGATKAARKLQGKLITECFRKVKMLKRHANRVVKRARKEGKTLYKYECRHCHGWHVTQMASTVYYGRTKGEK